MNPNIKFNQSSTFANPSNMDFANYGQEKEYLFNKRVLNDYFQLYTEVAIKITNIQNPRLAEVEIVPFDDILKRYLLTDTSTDYYFILSKQDYESTSQGIEFSIVGVNIASVPDDYYIYLRFFTLQLVAGAGDNPPTGGVRLPR
jgi:hypothetical protein